MKKLFAFLCTFVLILSSFTFWGCGSNLEKVSSQTAIDLATTFKPLDIEKGGIKIVADANVYGMKSDTFYEIVLNGADLQMYGKSDPMDIKTTFYYTGGYVYGKSLIDDEVVKLKQQISLSEFIFGTERYSVIDDRITLPLVSNPLYAVSTFAKDLDSEFYVNDGENLKEIKIVLKTSEYYPQADHTINSTQTFIYKYDIDGNFTSVKVELKDVRVSRGFKENSKTVLTIKPFDGEIELPSAEELAKYKEPQPE